MRLRKKFIALVIALTITCQPHTTRAATVTTAIAVTATVLSACVVVALPLVFGNYSSATMDATTTVSVTCTSTTTFSVGLSAGNATGATTTTRKMTNGASALSYTLSTDGAHSINWGNIPGTDAVAGLGSGLLQLLTVYGRIAANQFVTPGAYADVVVVTITY